MILAGCGNDNTVINGSIFIVTKGGMNFKLGLVPVTLISNEAIDQYLNSQFEQRLEEFKRDCQTITQKFNVSNEKYQQLWPDYLATENIYKKKRKILEQYASINYDSNTIRWTSSIESEFDSALEDFLIIESMLTEKEIQLKPKYNECVNNKKQLQSLRDQTMAGISRGILTLSEQTTKTDADGKFAFTVEQGKDYIIWATSQREVVGEKEFYFWFTTLNIPQGQKGEFQLMLSNDNLFESFLIPLSSCVDTYLSNNPKINKEYELPDLNFKQLDIQTKKIEWIIEK